MLQKYKEIFVGLAFGLSAAILDTAIDALSNGNSLADEVAERPAMLWYRGVFVLLGLVLGWLLWRGNRREREYRQLLEMLRNIQQDCEKQTLLVKALLQNLMIRKDVQLSDEASQMVQQAYQETTQLQRIAELKLPSVDT